MAKHDQTLLKFLNQNSDRAPTLIDMMTKLKIGISDLTDSLADLLAKGVIAKHTNEQGMETWSVASKSTPPPATATETIAKPMPVMESPAAKIEASPVSVPKIEVEPAPVEAPKVESVAASPVSPIPTAAEASYSPSANYSSAPYYPAPVNKGIGLFTFIVGLLLTAGLSVWLGSRLAHKEIEQISKDFVNQKMFTDIGNAFLVFEDKTKVETTALKDQVKLLQAQLTAVQSVSDSLKVVLAAAQAEKASTKGKKAKTARRR